MSISLIKEREFLTDFIRYYKQLPALWNKKIQLYYEPAEKKKSYMLLLKKYRENYPKATLNDVKKKIGYLRTNCRKYYRSGMEDSRSGMHYLKELFFIIENEEVDTEMDVETTYLELKCDSLSSEMSMSDPFNDQDESTEEIEYLETLESDDDTIKCAKRKNKTIKKQSTPKRLYKSKVTQKPTVIYKSEIKKKGISSVNVEVDDNNNWWKWIAAEFKKMDPMQQIIAQKAITDVLLVGRQGMLTKDSVQINQSFDGQGIQDNDKINSNNV